jgi:hypothetical protein
MLARGVETSHGRARDRWGQPGAERRAEAVSRVGEIDRWTFVMPGGAGATALIFGRARLQKGSHTLTVTGGNPPASNLYAGLGAFYFGR